MPTDRERRRQSRNLRRKVEHRLRAGEHARATARCRVEYSALTAGDHGDPHSTPLRPGNDYVVALTDRRLVFFAVAGTVRGRVARLVLTQFVALRDVHSVTHDARGRVCLRARSGTSLALLPDLGFTGIVDLVEAVNTRVAGLGRAAVLTA